VVYYFCGPRWKCKIVISCFLVFLIGIMLFPKLSFSCIYCLLSVVPSQSMDQGVTMHQCYHYWVSAVNPKYTKPSSSTLFVKLGSSEDPMVFFFFNFSTVWCGRLLKLYFLSFWNYNSVIQALLASNILCLFQQKLASKIFFIKVCTFYIRLRTVYSCKTDYIIFTIQCVYFYIRLNTIYSCKTGYVISLQ
jgi:hypothetical protein